MFSNWSGVFQYFNKSAPQGSSSVLLTDVSQVPSSSLAYRRGLSLCRMNEQRWGVNVSLEPPAEGVDICGKWWKADPGDSEPGKMPHEGQRICKGRVWMWAVLGEGTLGTLPSRL